MLAHPLYLDELLKEERSFISNASLAARSGRAIARIPKVKGFIYRLILVPRINHHLRRALVSSQLMLRDINKIEQLNVDELKDTFENSNFMLQQINRLYYKLEPINFFYSSLTRRIIDDLMSTEYSINRHLRMSLFDKQPSESDPEDEKLYEIADKLTKSAIFHERSS